MHRIAPHNKHLAQKVNSARLKTNNKQKPCSSTTCLQGTATFSIWPAATRFLSPALYSGSSSNVARVSESGGLCLRPGGYNLNPLSTYMYWKHCQDGLLKSQPPELGPIQQPGTAWPIRALGCYRERSLQLSTGAVLKAVSQLPLYSSGKGSENTGVMA